MSLCDKKNQSVRRFVEISLTKRRSCEMSVAKRSKVRGLVEYM